MLASSDFIVCLRILSSSSFRITRKVLREGQRSRGYGHLDLTVGGGQSHAGAESSNQMDVLEKRGNLSGLKKARRGLGVHSREAEALLWVRNRTFSSTQADCMEGVGGKRGKRTSRCGQGGRTPTNECSQGKHRLFAGTFDQKSGRREVA